MKKMKWINGERWILSDDKTRYIRLLDLAPNLEKSWIIKNWDIVCQIKEGYTPSNIGCE